MPDERAGAEEGRGEERGGCGEQSLRLESPLYLTRFGGLYRTRSLTGAPAPLPEYSFTRVGIYVFFYYDPLKLTFLTLLLKADDLTPLPVKDGKGGGRSRGSSSTLQAKCYFRRPDYQCLRKRASAMNEAELLYRSDSRFGVPFGKKCPDLWLRRRRGYLMIILLPPPPSSALSPSQGKLAAAAAATRHVLLHRCCS